MSSFFSRFASFKAQDRRLTNDTVTSQIISAGMRFSGCWPQITHVGEVLCLVLPKNKLFLSRREKKLFKPIKVRSPINLLDNINNVLRIAFPA